MDRPVVEKHISRKRFQASWAPVSTKSEWLMCCTAGWGRAKKIWGRGGLVLYAPRVWGKTNSGKALEGEWGSIFTKAGRGELVPGWVGESERTPPWFLDNARRNAPCVLFFDEVDAL